ncbi:hypothetical protein GIB67_008107, partial [Kingdonia uniflora]
PLSPLISLILGLISDFRCDKVQEETQRFEGLGLVVSLYLNWVYEILICRKDSYQLQSSVGRAIEIE